jgi:hypothetical protein|nr:MAG TPA: hypothetical protein [Crassvirales sp.]
MLNISRILIIELPLFLIFFVCFLVVILNILERLISNKIDYCLEGDVIDNLLFFLILFVPIYNLYVAYDISKTIIKLIIKTIKNGFTSKN